MPIKKYREDEDDEGRPTEERVRQEESPEVEEHGARVRFRDEDDGEPQSEGDDPEVEGHGPRLIE